MGGSPGVDPRLEEYLIRVDIPDSGDDRLVEEQAFQATLPVSYDLVKGVEIKVQRLRAKVPQLIAARRLGSRERTEEPELPDISKAQLVSLPPKAEDEVSVFVGPLLRREEKELPCHFEMEKETPVAFAVDKDHFSPPPKSEDLPAIQFSKVGIPSSSQELGEKELGGLDLEPLESRGKAPDNRFDLWQFRHVPIVQQIVLDLPRVFL